MTWNKTHLRLSLRRLFRITTLILYITSSVCFRSWLLYQTIQSGDVRDEIITVGHGGTTWETQVTTAQALGVLELPLFGVPNARLSKLEKIHQRWPLTITAVPPNPPLKTRTQLQALIWKVLLIVQQYRTVACVSYYWVNYSNIRASHITNILSFRHHTFIRHFLSSINFDRSLLTFSPFFRFEKCASEKQ